MHFELDEFDIKILLALQSDGTLTNAQLGDLVALSASQCSRRRLRLEKEGIIASYHAKLNTEAFGLTLRAIVRVNLNSHSEENADGFAKFLNRQEEVSEAFSVSGDADYVLIVQCRGLAAFADFIHRTLLPFAHVGQVRSEIVLKEIKRAF